MADLASVCIDVGEGVLPEVLLKGKFLLSLSGLAVVILINTRLCEQTQTLLSKQGLSHTQHPPTHPHFPSKIIKTQRSQDMERTRSHFLNLQDSNPVFSHDTVAHEYANILSLIANG